MSETAVQKWSPVLGDHDRDNRHRPCTHPLTVGPPDLQADAAVTRTVQAPAWLAEAGEGSDCTLQAGGTALLPAPLSACTSTARVPTALCPQITSQRGKRLSVSSRSLRNVVDFCLGDPL